MTPPFTMIGSSVALVEQSKHKDFPEGIKYFQEALRHNIFV